MIKAVFPNPFLLVLFIIKNKSLHFNRIPIALVYFSKAILMLPGRFIEQLFIAPKIRKTKLKKDPVFIIGHYRSGTTYLHKLMATNKNWGFINTYNFLFPFSPLIIEKHFGAFLQKIAEIASFKHPHFNNYDYNFADPLEEDMYLIGALYKESAFWGEVFPKQAETYFNSQIFFENEEEKKSWSDSYDYCVKKFTHRHGGKRLILKNPPNAGRVKALLDLYPHAKFIFIYRNPYQVYYSTLHLWLRTIEKVYSLQKISDKEREDIIFNLYNGLMTRYYLEKSLIPAGNLVEVKYETLKDKPGQEIKKIYDTLGLEDYDHIKSALNKRLNKEKNYKTYNYSYDDVTQDKVYEHWKEFIDKYSYEKLTKSPH